MHSEACFTRGGSNLAFGVWCCRAEQQSSTATTLGWIGLDIMSSGAGVGERLALLAGGALALALVQLLQAKRRGDSSNDNSQRSTAHNRKVCVRVLVLHSHRHPAHPPVSAPIRHPRQRQSLQAATDYDTEVYIANTRLQEIWPCNANRTEYEERNTHKNGSRDLMLPGGHLCVSVKAFRSTPSLVVCGPTSDVIDGCSQSDMSARPRHQSDIMFIALNTNLKHRESRTIAKRIPH